MPKEVTLEDIEKQVESSLMIRIAMKRVVDQLKNAEKHSSPEVIKVLINGKRKMGEKEYAETAKRFGSKGLEAIERLEHLTKPQKQYLFKQMGYSIEEVE